MSIIYIGKARKSPSIYHRYGIRYALPKTLLGNRSYCYDVDHPSIHIHLKTDSTIKTSLKYDRYHNSKKQKKSNSTSVDKGKNNLFVQLTGSRTFVLFPPQYCQGGVMMPFEDYHINHISKSTTFLHSVTEHSSNLQKQLKFIEESEFPSLAGPWLHRVVIRLNAGDGLLIPARWWYYCIIDEPGVALSWLLDKTL